MHTSIMVIGIGAVVGGVLLGFAGMVGLLSSFFGGQIPWWASILLLATSAGVFFGGSKVIEFARLRMGTFGIRVLLAPPTFLFGLLFAYLGLALSGLHVPPQFDPLGILDWGTIPVPLFGVFLVLTGAWMIGMSVWFCRASSESIRKFWRIG